MSNSAAVTPRHPRETHHSPAPFTRIARVTAALALCATWLASACMHQPAPLADVPGGRAHRPNALFVLRSTECDANVAVLQLLDRAAIKRGIDLIGIVLSDGDSTAAVVRSQLRAFDVTAPLLRVSAATRDSLIRLVANRGPALIVRSPDGVVTHVLPAPQTSSQYRALVTTLTAIATSAVANR